MDTDKDSRKESEKCANRNEDISTRNHCNGKEKISWVREQTNGI